MDDKTEKEGSMISEVYHGDCMDLMAKFPDKFFDLAVVDPPYFSGPDKLGYYGERVSSAGIKRPTYAKIGSWGVPGEEYFNELTRVSVNCIIWGINYYNISLGPGRIIWDKVNDSSSFSDAEIAYCSLQETVKIFRFMWNGMLQGKSMIEGHVMQGNKKLNEKRIHPTQKPVALYKWLLKNYAKPCDKILDTHMGSQSSRIAAHDMGFDYWGSELDEEYFRSGCERYQKHISQLTLEFK